MTSSSRPVISSTYNLRSSNSEVDEAEEKNLAVARGLVNFMDNPENWSSHELSEDAFLDWFGRSVMGRESILNFVRAHIPKTRHTLEKVTKIPPINHRYLKNLNISQIVPQTPLAEECGQGDCKGLSTPENVVVPNVKELVKAPRKKQYNGVSFDLQKCQFLEIKGRLEFEHVSSDRTIHLSEKKLERIILMYTDQIHLVVYEANNTCRKRLASLFHSVDE